MSNKNMSHEQIRNHPDFIRPVTKCANTFCQHNAAAHERVDKMHHYRGACGAFDCKCEAFVKVPTVEQMNQRMTPQEEREYFDAVAEVIEPPSEAEIAILSNSDRPDYRAKHINHLASLFALEANFIVNYALTVTESDWGNGAKYLEALKNLEGRCHEWQVLVASIGASINERTPNFDVKKWRETCTYDKVNMIYLAALKDIREFEKAGK